jgi:hypothetical protein
MASDQKGIGHAIAEAGDEDRPISDAAARAIAAQLHGPGNPAMTALSTTGAILYRRLAAEILRDYHDESLDPEVKGWLAELMLYRITHGPRRPVDGWHMLWPTDAPETDTTPEYRA